MHIGIFRKHHKSVVKGVTQIKRVASCLRKLYIVGKSRRVQ